MISRFSVRSLFLLTAVMAIAIASASVRGNGAADYALGALTGVIAIGLVQQLFALEAAVGKSRKQRDLRRCCLFLILVGLLLGILPTLSTYRLNDDDSFGMFQRYGMRREAAESVWVFALVLGSLTAPWMSLRAKSPGLRRNRAWSAVVSTLVVSLVCFYLIYIISNVASIAALIDIAINGVEVGLLQPTATQTPEYVERFGRSPAEFRVFLDRQYLTWPPLFLSTLFLVVTCQRKHGRMRAWIVVGASVICAIPVVLNLYWLANGTVAKLFPLFFNVGLDRQHERIVLTSIGTVLLTLYLSSRRAGSTKVTESSPVPTKIVSDGVIVGMLFVVFGLTGIVNSFYLKVGDFFGIKVESITELISELVLTPHRWEIIGTLFANILLYPQHSCQILMLPFGVYWLWRRSKFPTEQYVERWPQLDTDQLLLSLVLFCSLALLIVSAIPFGMALMHAAS